MPAKTPLSEKVRLWFGPVIVVVTYIFTAGIYHQRINAAEEKVKTLEDAVTKLADVQVKMAQTAIVTKSTADGAVKKADKNEELMKKLSEVQVQQNLLINTQKVELKYIKQGVDKILSQGG